MLFYCLHSAKGNGILPQNAIERKKMILDVLKKSSHTLDNLSDLVATLRGMKNKAQRVSLFNQIAGGHFQQTVAQKIYDAIYQQEQKAENQAHNQGEKYTFDPFGVGIDKYLQDPKLASELRDILAIQRQARQKEIKQKTVEDNALVYHISNRAPDQIKNGALEPRLQLEHFRDQGMVKAVFASGDPSWAMALKIGKDVSTSVSRTDAKTGTVIVSDRDKFLSFKAKNPYSYQYRFPVDAFEPNVGYNGLFTGEWYCLGKSVQINPQNQECRSVDDVVVSGVRLYFIAEGHSFSRVCADLRTKQQTMQDLLKSGALVQYKKGDLEVYKEEQKAFQNRPDCPREMSLLKMIGQHVSKNL